MNRITEQALISILEYSQNQNESESSKSLNACSLPRENARAGSSVWYERRLRKQKPSVSALPSIDWKAFESWVKSEYRPKTAYDVLWYVKRYSHCLLENNLSELFSLSNDKRSHAMKGLSALSKFLGAHEHFLTMVRNYGLKWSVRSDDLIITRFTKTTNSNEVFEWIQKVKETCSEISDFMDLMAITGLRFNEAIESYNLIIKLSREGKLSQYYNEDRKVLEHFRFKEIFIRRTKKASISFIPKELIQKISDNEPVNIHTAQTRVKRKTKKLRFSDIREAYGTFLTKYLRESEIDFLHGRVSTSVFMRNYFNPALISDLKERTFKAIADLQVLT